MTMSIGGSGLTDSPCTNTFEPAPNYGLRKYQNTFNKIEKQHLVSEFKNS